MPKNFHYVLVPLLSSIFIISIWIQSQILISPDIGWLLTVGKAMLAGGKYYFDFFEVNPPMAVYLYLPALELADLFHWSTPFTIKAYTFVTIFVVLAICHSLAKRILSSTFLLIIPLATAFLFLPVQEFGQREHFSLLLTFPYLLLLTVIIKSRQVSLPLRFLIGLLAGIGFIIKPYFLIPWILIEIYFLYQVRLNYLSFPRTRESRFFNMVDKTNLDPRVRGDDRLKNRFPVFRVELLVIILVGIIYAITLPIITPEYLYNMLPAINKIYYFAYLTAWQKIIMSPISVLWLITFLFYLNVKKHSRYPELISLIFLFNTGFFLVYLIQRTVWYYHLLPTISLSFILLILLLADYISANKEKQKLFKFFAIVYSILFLLLYPIVVALDYTRFAFIVKNDPIRQHLLSAAKIYGKDKPIFAFSNDIDVTNPMLNYAGAKSASRFPCLWPVRAVLVAENLKQDYISQGSIRAQKTFLINAVTEDLLRNKPILVIMDNPKKVPLKNKSILIDHLAFFSEDMRFRQLWQHYHYQGTIGNYQLYILNSAIFT